MDITTLENETLVDRLIEISMRRGPSASGITISALGQVQDSSIWALKSEIIRRLSSD